MCLGSKKSLSAGKRAFAHLAEFQNAGDAPRAAALKEQLFPFKAAIWREINGYVVAKVLAFVYNSECIKITRNAFTHMHSLMFI